MINNLLLNFLDIFYQNVRGLGTKQFGFYENVAPRITKFYIYLKHFK
jgi:hypothetical protein